MKSILLLISISLVSSLATAADSCRTDKDCVLVSEGPCACSNGGKQIAIAKKNVAAHQQKFATMDVMCMAMISNDPSCDPKAKAVCEKRKCALKTGAVKK